MKLLDLFCGAGGASVGYARAGFEVVGVDVEDHPNYPYRMLVGDALNVGLDVLYDGFEVLHASPPCQAFTQAQYLRGKQRKADLAGKYATRNQARRKARAARRVDLLSPTRAMLVDWSARTGGVYVIENVVGAPLLDPVQVCGSSFGLKVRRHRLFESNVRLMPSACRHAEQGVPVGVYGELGDTVPEGGSVAVDLPTAREAMGIDWMARESLNKEWLDLKEAIPPAYTEFLGLQIRNHL